MTTVKTSASVDNDGHLRVDVPTQLPPGQVDVVLVIDTDPTPRRTYDFSDVAGKLNWRGDAVAEQRSLRDEW